jgi:hypothetical protein
LPEIFCIYEEFAAGESVCLLLLLH